MAAAKPDLKKHLEAIVGHTLSSEELQTIKLTQAVATSNIILDGSITSRGIIFALPNSCVSSRLLEVGGFAATGSDGKATFRLNAFLCPFGGIGPIVTTSGAAPPPPAPKYVPPVNVVATPLSSEPFFLTLTRSLVDNGADVEIKVATWDADGSAAPNVSFDWRCRVPLLDIIL